MKPWLLTIFCLVLIFGLAACGNKPDDSEAVVSDAVSSEASISVSEADEAPPESEAPVSQEEPPPEEPAILGEPQESEPPRETPYPLAYMNIYNLLKNSPHTEYAIPVKELYVDPAKVPDGYIRYQAPKDCFTGSGGGGVICFPREKAFENPDIYDVNANIKFGEFQFFGSLKNWVLYDADGNEVYRLSVGWDNYPLDDPRAGVFKSDDNTLGALKETEKYQRVVDAPIYHIYYLVDLGQGYGATVYFFVPEELTGPELEVYDKIVESMTFVLE